MPVFEQRGIRVAELREAIHDVEIIAIGVRHRCSL